MHNYSYGGGGRQERRRTKTLSRPSAGNEDASGVLTSRGRQQALVVGKSDSLIEPPGVEDGLRYNYELKIQQW